VTNLIATPLLIDVFLDKGRVSGVSRALTERGRLVDMLNAGGDVLELESAKITLGDGPPCLLPTLAVEKRAIVAAIPRETQGQSRARARLSAGMGRITATRIRLAVLLPGLYIEGTAHVAIGGGMLRANEVFPSFFAIGDARLVLPDGSLMGVPAVVIRRDAVAGMSQLGRRGKLSVV
jgi:hypothetical protein